MQHTVLSVLWLKGSLNEYELDLLRQRSVEARREKARRGELIVSAARDLFRLESEPGKRVVLQVSNADKFVAERLCVLRLPSRKSCR